MCLFRRFDLSDSFFRVVKLEILELRVELKSSEIFRVLCLRIGRKVLISRLKWIILIIRGIGTMSI